MAELVRGTVRDQPWGPMLSGLAERGFIGLVKMQAETRRYVVTFEGGRIVGATSPLPADSVIRIGVTTQLVPAAQSAAVQKALAAAPDRDEVDVVVETIGLSADQADRLRKRVLRQRAARTFSLEDGELVVTEAMPARPRAAVDVYAVVYLGARLFASETRLADELRRMGGSFQMDPERTGDLAAYGFTEAEQPIIRGLRKGASVAELEAVHRDLDPRMLQAAVYALVSCGTCKPMMIASPRMMAQARSEEVGNGEVRLPTGSGEAAKLVAHGGLPTQSFVENDPEPASQREDLAAARTKTPLGGFKSRPPARAPKLDPADARTLAKEHFLKGDQALREGRLDTAITELSRACELQPGQPDYAALLAWTRFWASDDQPGAAPETREALENALIESSALAQLCLGRLERALGRDREALRHFQELAANDPGNAELADEIRELEGRLAGSAT